MEIRLTADHWTPEERKNGRRERKRGKEKERKRKGKKKKKKKKKRKACYVLIAGKAEEGKLGEGGI